MALFGLSASAATARVQVEMVADVVCPYCYVGLSRLQKAIAALSPSTTIDITYTPFILRRHLPKEGVPKKEVFRAQFGSDERGEQVLAGVRATAAADGLCFDTEGQRAGNSEDAHRLLLWAGGDGSQRQLELFEAMVKAYNCERGWLGDHEVLLRAVASTPGLDVEAARAVLVDSSAHAQALEAGLRRAEELGVRGVPSFFVNGKPLGSGAPAVDVLRDVIAESCTAPA